MVKVPWYRMLWFRWRSLRSVPFRKSWFVGFDLEGNTYWEQINRNYPQRLRRMARPVGRVRNIYHVTDFHPPPQWLQWMRHTRKQAPSLQELVQDLQRQHHMKILAQQADERWRSVPLKSPESSLNSSNDDPRLASAWTPGQKPAAETDEPATPVNSAINTAQERMIEAEQRIYLSEKKKKESREKQTAKQ